MFKFKKYHKKEERVWLFKEDFVGHKPCLLPDGRVRTATHDFESIDALKAYLWDFGQRCHGVEEYHSVPVYEYDDEGNEHFIGAEPKPTWVYHEDTDRRAVLRWIGAMCDLDRLCPDSGVVNIIPECLKHPNNVVTQVFASAPDAGEGECELFLDINYDLDSCCSALQDDDVDKSVLTSARPELSTFATTYPLSTAQASIISTILGNIEFINTERLFNLLLPVFVEAVDCGINRRIANNELMSTDDPAEVEAWMINIIKEAHANGIGKLPTVKEVLNKSKTIQFWN